MTIVGGPAGEVRIVPATTDDFQEIVEVWEASVRATHDFLSEEDILFLKPLILNEYLAAVDVLCLKTPAGDILGFIGTADRNIEMLFIAPSCFGSGYGRMLLNHAVRELGADKVDVNEQNPAALDFYRHMGFKVVGRSPVDGQGRPFPLLHLGLKE